MVLTPGWWGAWGVRRALDLDLALCHLTGLGRVLGEGHLGVLGWVVRAGRNSVMGGWVPWVAPPQTLRASLTKAAADGLGTPY